MDETKKYTVIGTRAKREFDEGTWLVNYSCQVLNELESDLPLVEVLTRVQHKIMEIQSVGDAGQTPEYKILPADSNFTFRR